MDISNVEICCNSVSSAENAKKGGAKRIELCQGLSEGGTTPSFATINYAVNELGLSVFVLIRPRGGNFIYSEAEIKTMEKDVEMCKKIGVSGIVVGFLTENGDIDTKLTEHFVEISSPLPVTFHRAFDECKNPEKALEDIISCGCCRILTSGCKPTAIEGKDMLKLLVNQANNRITILAGSGITPENALEVIESTGVTEIHGSCKSISANGSSETDPEIVKNMLNTLKIS